MASGTKIRALTRLLDASAAPVWVIGADGKLVYLSAAIAGWAGVDVQSLEGRSSVAGSPASDDPLDQLAAALAPPPGLTQQGTAALRMQLPPLGQHQGEPIEARFVRVGTGEDAFTLAVAGHFSDQHPSLELRDAVAIRSRL